MYVYLISNFYMTTQLITNVIASIKTGGKNEMESCVESENISVKLAVVYLVNGALALPMRMIRYHGTTTCVLEVRSDLLDCHVFVIIKYILIYKSQDTHNNYISVFLVQVTCGKGTLSPRCELCPKPNDTTTDEQWCEGNCGIDKHDGVCKETCKLSNKVTHCMENNDS